jgi:hypothetical protein
VDPASGRTRSAPNPNSIKWVLGRGVSGPSAHFDALPPPFPLAARLFAIEGVAGVFLASNFVTVTKRAEIEWTDLAQPVVDALKACLGDGGAALGPAFEAESAASEGEVVDRIRRILDEEVRPSPWTAATSSFAFRDGRGVFISRPLQRPNRAPRRPC